MYSQGSEVVRQGFCRPANTFARVTDFLGGIFNWVIEYSLYVFSRAAYFYYLKPAATCSTYLLT